MDSQRAGAPLVIDAHARILASPGREPAASLLAQMDFAGVGKAMLHHAGSQPMPNDRLAAVVSRHPERFRAAARIREAACNTGDQILELRRAVGALGLSALHFCVEGAFDGEACTPFWEEVRRLRVPVLWDIPSDAGTPPREALLEQVVRLGRWARRWPGVPCVVTRNFSAGLSIDGAGRATIPDELWHTLDADNVAVELFLPGAQRGRWAYPFPEAHDLIKELHRRVGAARMLWGSGYPSPGAAATYLESLDYVLRYCEFLGPYDKGLILGANAARLYGFG